MAGTTEVSTGGVRVDSNHGSYGSWSIQAQEFS